MKVTEKKSVEVKKTVKSKQKKVTIQVGNGIIEQARQRRCDTDKIYADRTEAFSSIKDKEKHKDDFKFTSMCRSVLTGKKCYHKSCRFAHTIEQLELRQCKFGQECRFVVRDEGVYKNKNNNRPCAFLHPEESKEQLEVRLGIKRKKPIVNRIEVVKPVLVLQQIATYVDKVYKVDKVDKVCITTKHVTSAWSKPLFKKHRVSRWDEVSNVMKKVYKEVTNINNRLVNIVVKRSVRLLDRWDEVSSVMKKVYKEVEKINTKVSNLETKLIIFRVSKDNAKEAIERIIESGFYNFQIVLE